MKARIVVVETVYHQVNGKQPVQVGEPWAADLESDEQPYVRYLDVGQEWVPLDRGWIASASILIIANQGPALLEIGIHKETLIVVPAKQTARFKPAVLGELMVRCADGTTRVVVNLFPE